MSAIQDQVHDHFKMFAGESIQDLMEQAARFAAERQIASKSIGVEYLEGARRFVLTLGYREDEEAYPVAFELHDLGRADDLSELSAIEARMGGVAARTRGILCHELYINAAHEFFLVIMRLTS